MGKKAHGFLTGAGMPFRAVGIFLKNPKYWKYLTWPIVISVILYAALGFLFFWYLMPLATDWLPNVHNSWLRWLYDALEIIIKILYVLIVIGLFLITFTAAFMVVAAPFIDFLALRYEKDVYSFEPAKAGFKAMAGYYWTSVINNLVLGFWIVFWSIVFLPVSIFFPYFGFIAGTLVLGYLVGLTFLVFSAEHRRIPRRDFKKLLRGNRMLILGCGVVVYFLLFIPFVAIVFLPVSVLAGTIIFNEYMLPRQQQMSVTDEQKKIPE
jgi:CysZ protein